jgi:putative PEP-CTERM system TPR-repeat lipoprotein
MTIRRTTRLFAIALVAAAVAIAGCGRNDPATLVASAKSYLAKGDAKAAVIELKNALQAKPDNPEARYLLAKALLDSGDAAGAETEARKALDLKHLPDEVYPVLANALLQQGEYRKLVDEISAVKLASPQAIAETKTAVALAHLSLGDRKEAGVAAAAALAAKPGDVRAMVAQAQIVAADGDLPAAAALVEKAIASAPNDTVALLLMAEIQLARDQRDDGIKTLERVVALKPDLVAARLMLISTLANAGQPDRAAAALEPLKKEAPQDPRTRYAEAIVAYAKGDMTAARDAIQSVVTAAPDHLPSVYLSGLIQYRLGSWQAAADSFRAVLAKSPDNVAVRRLLAATYLRMGRTADAAEALEPALQKYPDDPTLLRAAAEVQVASNNPAKAAALYERAAALDKGNVAGQVRLAQARIAAGGGDADRAIRELESLAQSNPDQTAADIALISENLRRRDTDKALAAATALEKKQPSNPLVYNLKGVVYSSKHDYTSARASFERALKVDANYTAAAFNLAQLDLIQRNTAGARKRYEDILAKDPRNEQALIAVANLLAATRAPAAEVKAALEKAVAANPSSVRSRLVLINYYAQQRDGKGALDAARAANTAIPNNPQILDALGGAQIAAGESNQALETFTRAVKQQPENAHPLFRLAAAQASAKDYDGAIGSLKKGIALQPGVATAWIALVGVYMVAGKVDAGIADARKMQKDLPTRAAGWVIEGHLLLSQKKGDEAVKAFREGLAREPVPAIAVTVYSALFTVGKKDQAVAFAQRWQKEHPRDPTLPLLQGQRALVAKDYATAVRELKAVLELDPDNVVALNNVAWALNEMGDAKAIEYAERAANAAPYAPSVMDTQGWILVGQGKIDRGLELLRTASNYSPQDAEIRLHLAKALLKSGDKTGAKSELEKIAVDTKATPARAEAQKMLQTL